MKKVISIILAVILFSASGTFVMAADSTPNIFFAESFESTATNGIPSSLTISGMADAYVTELGGRNKALLVDKQTYASTIKGTVDGATGDDLVFELDVYRTGALFNGGITLKSGTQTFKPFTFSEQGLKNTSGKAYGSIRPNKWVRLSFVLHKKSKSYDIYVDGKRALSGWRLENQNISGIDGFEINMKNTEKPATVMFDNLRIYEAENPLPDRMFPAMVYSEREDEYIPTKKEAGDAVLLDCDFNRTAGSVTKKTNKIELTEEKDGNKFMRYEIMGTDDAFIDFNLSKEAPYLVFEADVRSSNWKSNVQVFTLRFENGYQLPVTIAPGGALRTSNGVSAGILAKNKWVNVAIACRFAEDCFDFYVDGECIAKDQPIATDGGYPTLMRFYTSGEVGAIFDLDNLRIYEGKEPHALSDSNPSSAAADYSGIAKRWQQNSEAERLLGTSTAFNGSNGTVYHEGKKSKPAVGPRIEDKTAYLPVRTLANLFGLELFWDETQQAAILDGCVLKENAKSYTFGGKEMTLNTPIRMIDDSLYLPVDGIGKDRLLGVDVYTDWYGLVVFNPARSFSDDEAKTMVKYLVFDRPNAAQLKQDLASANHSGVHPRVLLDREDFDRIKHVVETDAYGAQLFKDIKKQADDGMRQPVCVYGLSDGVRLDAPATVLDRVQPMAFVYRITGDTAYAERAWQELEAVSKFPDWNPSHYLDTGVMSTAIAIGYDWLYDYLSEEQRTVVRNMIEENCLDGYLSSYQDQAWWTTLESNWTFVCNSGGIMGALAVADELPEKSYALIENALRNTEGADMRFSPDGGWYEGPNYWSYAMMYYTFLCASLDCAFDTDYGISKAPGVSQTTDFMLAMDGAVTAYTYSDSGSSSGTVTKSTSHPGVFQSMWLAQKFGRPDWAKLRIANRKKYGQAMDEFDLFWYDPATAEGTAEITMPLDMYYRDAEVAASRSSWTDSNALFLGYKGGYARQSHGQIDYGSFVFDLNGERWANDWGSENYNTPGYYSWDPAMVYLQRGESHNIIVINPKYDNEQDTYTKVNIARHESSDAGSIGVLDLSKAYPGEAKSAVRGFLVDDMRNSVTVRDELELENANSTVYWFMHTAIEDGKDFEIDGNTAILTGENGSKLRLDFLTNADSAEWVVMDSKPMETSPQVDGQRPIPYKKLAVKMTASGKVNLTVKMYDNALADFISPISDTPISEWTLPEGELLQKPQLPAIYANGELIEGFDPAITSYRLYRYYEEDDTVITADVPEGTTLETEKVGTMVKLILCDAENPMARTTYCLEVKAIPHIYESLDGFRRLSPKLITANHVPQPENPPENVNDGNIVTRYADNSADSWIELDLGSVQEIDAYAISYYQGTVRNSYYDILVSEDGKTYTTLFEGETSGLTEAYELFETPGLKTRYFRLVGHGNSMGVWNSPTEIALLQRPE